MSTTYGTAKIARTTASAPQVSGAFSNFWVALQEWRKWERLRTDLCTLSDRELIDIGVSRGEIDHVALHRDTDPRGICSAG